MVERRGDPVIQDLRGGAQRGGRDLEVCDKRGGGCPVSVVPPEVGWGELLGLQARSIVIGTWSEPVERRDVSHPPRKGRSRGLENARSITEGPAYPGRGNLVYTPGEFRKAKPPKAASSKCGVE